MLARVVNVQLQPGKVDESARIVREEIMPVMEQQKGFKVQHFFTQQDTNKAVSINIWETEADLTNFETAPIYRELMGKLAGVLAGPPVGERYTVSI
jgi:heme-degrading monooxygenase HmoA